MNIENKHKYDVIIIGAGAAGLMCAIEAGKNGHKVWLIDKSNKIAEKIRISGGGRCNFTNLYTSPDDYLSENPHFCKSALKQYTQYDFIHMVDTHNIPFHEKTLGQQFCDVSAKDIINMLLSECDQAGVKVDIGITVSDVKKSNDGYTIIANDQTYNTTSLVIATGGLSIPKMGATDFGYKVATDFGLDLIERRAGLVPLTFTDAYLEFCKGLSGVSVDAIVSYKKTQFREGLLFTHRGLSGPSILQISSYWELGNPITLNLAPDTDMFDKLKIAKTHYAPRKDILTILSPTLPKRLAAAICDWHHVSGPLIEISDKNLKIIADNVNNWKITPNGTEGYRTAEVTLGGVNTDEISSKTFECKKHKGLYFIGEVLDVTGHLGGFNFQWAWSSGYVAGRNI